MERKEAIEVIKSNWPDSSFTRLREALKTLIPELKESKDDRIKRDIIEVLRYGLECKESVLMPGATTTLKEATAWLEKQDSQNLDNSAKTCKDEHKHAWSENDEIALGDALWCCKQAAIIAKDENDMGNIWYAERWLKSIKERIWPQQEWSEEDSMFIKILRTMIAAYVKDDEERKKLVRWLDIHCNAYPIPNKLYPSWKPSDEQMADLWNMVCECRPADQQLLQDIYYGLKTLRGE